MWLDRVPAATAVAREESHRELKLTNLRATRFRACSRFCVEPYAVNAVNGMVKTSSFPKGSGVNRFSFLLLEGWCLPAFAFARAW